MDTRYQHYKDGPQFERILIDIEHLDLSENDHALTSLSTELYHTVVD